MRQQRGDEYHHDSSLSIIHNRDTLERINNESSQSISEKCFEFMEKLVMKERQVVNATTAFGGMYTIVNGQTIQCCISPKQTSSSSMQFNSSWSSFIRNIYSILKTNRKKKTKECSCKCTTSNVQMNDFTSVCQPLLYDHHQKNTLHTVITWYIHSTSFPLHEHETYSSLNEEWGQINDSFYKWPLYKFTTASTDPGEDVDHDDLVGDFMHRYFDGDLTKKWPPLSVQSPTRIIDSLKEIIIPAKKIDDNNDDDDHDDFHTFADKEDVITFEKVIIFCCRGIHSTCSCKQIQFQQISFKKTSISNDRPIEGLYLNKWPYIHGPQKHDQLSNVITSMSDNNLGQIQQTELPINNMDEEQPSLCPICIEDKYIDQKCFYQKLTLVNNNTSSISNHHHHVIV